MNKVNIKIFSALFSLIVLLSSTGVLLVHHTCTKCNSNDWHLFSAVNCQNNIFESECCSDNHHDESNCGINEHSDITPCCSNNGLFYKIGLFLPDLDNDIVPDYNDHFLILNDAIYVVNSIITYFTDNLTGKSPPILPVKPYILFEIFRS